MPAVASHANRYQAKTQIQWIYVIPSFLSRQKKEPKFSRIDGLFELCLDETTVSRPRPTNGGGARGRRGKTEQKSTDLCRRDRTGISSIFVNVFFLFCVTLVTFLPLDFVSPPDTQSNRLPLEKLNCKHRLPMSHTHNDHILVFILLHRLLLRFRNWLFYKKWLFSTKVGLEARESEHISCYFHSDDETSAYASKGKSRFAFSQFSIRFDCKTTTKKLLG